MKNEIKIVFFDKPNGLMDCYIACTVNKIIGNPQAYIHDLVGEGYLHEYERLFPDGYSVTCAGEILHEFNPKNVERQEKIESLEIINKNIENIRESSSWLIFDQDYPKELIQEAVSFYIDKLKAEG